MKGPKELLEREDNWVTRMGLSFGGERVVFRGKDLFHELRDMPWMEFFLYGITGRRFDKNQISLFEAIWVISTSYPDPRIWNNRVAALAGTCRSTGVLGVSSAIAVSEATIYGFKPIIAAHRLITRMRDKWIRGEDLEEAVINEVQKSRSLPGYARPLVREDERIKPLMLRAHELGLGDGEHTAIAFQIENILLMHRYRMHINVAALAAALAADQGLSANEYYRYLIPCFLGGIIPCFIDAFDQAEGTLFPLSCHRVIYEGKNKRTWD